MLAHPWREVEIALTAANNYDNPYTDVDVWADFSHANGDTLRRPAFWDGDGVWKIRFASPVDSGEWTWQQLLLSGGQRPGRADGNCCLPTRRRDGQPLL